MNTTDNMPQSHMRVGVYRFNGRAEAILKSLPSRLGPREVLIRVFSDMRKPFGDVLDAYFVFCMDGFCLPTLVNAATLGKPYVRRRKDPEVRLTDSSRLKVFVDGIIRPSDLARRGFTLDPKGHYVITSSKARPEEFQREQDTVGLVMPE